MAPKQSWRNRIVGHEDVRAADLIANPDKFRVHNALQLLWHLIEWLGDQIKQRLCGYFASIGQRVVVWTQRYEILGDGLSAMTPRNNMVNFQCLVETTNPTGVGIADHRLPLLRYDWIAGWLFVHPAILVLGTAEGLAADCRWDALNCSVAPVALNSDARSTRASGADDSDAAIRRAKSLRCLRWGVRVSTCLARAWPMLALRDGSMPIDITKWPTSLIDRIDRYSTPTSTRYHDVLPMKATL